MSFLVSCLLIGALLACVAIVLSPQLKPDKPGILALLATAAGAVAGGTALWPDPRLLHLPLLLAALALVPALTVMRCFRSLDTIAILFHRDFGMQGVALKSLKNEIATAVLAAGLMTALISVLARHWAAEALVLVVGAAVLVAINPLVRLAVLRRLSPSVPSVLVDHLRAPVLRDGGENPDLVIVYLEGLDRRFADPQRFGPIYKPLQAYADEGISFTGVGQIAGTGWSLAGMVASQSGVPVPPRAFHYQSRTETLTRFMPGVPFLGDVLARRGYQSHYVVGGELGFGGIGAMYATHRITAQTGLDEQRALYPADVFNAARVGWFLDDQMVFDTALRLHAEMLSRPAPLSLLVETIGPHGPKGYLSRRFSRDGQARETPDIARAAGCLIEELDAFLAEIRAQQAARGRPLRIVLLSDHLNHSPRLPGGKRGHDESNTVILWGGAQSGQVVARQGSMVDVFPTLLHWLGWADVPTAAGLGRSLLADPPTLVETFGIAALNRMIQSDAAFASRIWDESACLAEPARSA